MIHYHALVATPHAGTYLFKLCKHFARKVPVEFDAQRGQVCFPYGSCVLESGTDGLRLRSSGESLEQVQQVMAVLDSHLALMTRQAPLQIAWQPD